MTHYSVMQTDRNSFCGDVVLDSFNMSYRDGESILDQIYTKNDVQLIFMMILILALKTDFISFLCIYAVFLLICIFFKHF